MQNEPRTITFEVTGRPKQQPRGQAVAFKQKDGTYRGAVRPPKDKRGELAVYRLACRDCCVAAMDPGGPLDGPVSVVVLYCFPTGKSKIKTIRPDEWRDKKPDIDNLAKATLDALKGIAWHDDAQVALKLTGVIDVDKREFGSTIVIVQQLLELPDIDRTYQNLARTMAGHLPFCGTEARLAEFDY